MVVVVVVVRKGEEEEDDDLSKAAVKSRRNEWVVTQTITATARYVTVGWSELLLVKENDEFFHIVPIEYV